MRRELKIGVVVTLSVALAAAVFVGRAFSGGEQQFTRLDADQSADPGTREQTPEPAVRPPEAPSGEAASPDDELEHLLENLASGNAAVEPVPRRPLSTPPAVTVDLDAPREPTAVRPAEEPAQSGAVAVLDESPAAAVAAADAPKEPQPAASNSAEDLETSSLIDKWIAEMAAEKSSAKPAAETAKSSVSKSDAEEGASQLERLLAGVGESPSASVITTSEPPSAPGRENLDSILGLDGDSATAESTPDSPDTYTVKHGDSFWLVARKVYGKGHLWRQIAAANPGVDPLNLPEGKDLHIPPLEEPVPAGDVTPVAPQDAKTHVVKHGESLWDIASEHYGKGWRWKLIAQANPQVNPNMLLTGATLIIPDEKQALEQTAEVAAVNAQPLPEGFREHVIQPFDRLWNISREYYGSGTLYRTILAANPGINDAHALPVGKTLLIPPKPDVE